MSKKNAKIIAFWLFILALIGMLITHRGTGNKISDDKLFIYHHNDTVGKTVDNIVELRYHGKTYVFKNDYRIVEIDNISNFVWNDSIEIETKSVKLFGKRLFFNKASTDKYIQSQVEVIKTKGKLANAAIISMYYLLLLAMIELTYSIIELFKSKKEDKIK